MHYSPHLSLLTYLGLKPQIHTNFVNLGVDLNYVIITLTLPLP